MGHKKIKGKFSLKSSYILYKICADVNKNINKVKVMKTWSFYQVKKYNFKYCKNAYLFIFVISKRCK